MSDLQHTETERQHSRDCLQLASVFKNWMNAGRQPTFSAGDMRHIIQTFENSAALSHPSQPVGAVKALELAADALKPLADAVFNDNGDMTVSPPLINAEQCIRAYFAVKGIRSALEASTPVKALEADAPHLTSGERFLLEWLSKEESSALGECEGWDLAHLEQMGLISAAPEGKHRHYSRVSLTDAGRSLLAAPVKGETEGWRLVPVDRSEMLRKIESVLNIPSAGHASAGELADTILDALGFTEASDA